jgi:glutamate formiminotransferase
MMFSVNVPVLVIGFTGDLGDNIEQVVDELTKLDKCNSDLLDFAADSDASNNTATFTVTVRAHTIEEAMAAGVSCIRAAIHATGAATHGWDDSRVGDQVVIYQADADEGVEVRPLVDA